MASNQNKPDRYAKEPESPSSFSPPSSRGKDAEAGESLGVQKKTSTLVIRDKQGSSPKHETKPRSPASRWKSHLSFGG